MSQPSAVEPSWKFTGPWLRFLLIAILGVGLDLWSKQVMFPGGVERAVPTGELLREQGRYPQSGPPQELIPGVLVMQTIVNKGAVFGIGEGKVTFFLGFSVLATGLILWVFVTSKRNQIWLQMALGLILAGALGNMYDRAVFGAVRDFLMFTVKWYPWIFNVADVLLCVGVPLLVICWMFTKDAGAGKPGFEADADKKKA